MFLKRLFLAVALVLTGSAVAPFGDGGAEARQVFDPSSRTWREIGPTAKYGKSKIKRKMIRYDTKQKPGTIVVNTKERRLYHVQGNGKAMRYGIGVGRDGFQWSGTHRVSRKAEWPGWTPPAAMRKRQPGLPAYMPGGISNPLGARALYIGSTIYRIHGSNEPWSIGQAVSSGCIRMTNQDVEHLYERVRVGAKVIVVR